MAALGAVALAGVVGIAGSAVLPVAWAGVRPALALLPALAALTSYVAFMRPALRDLDGAAARLRAERDGTRENAARLKAETERAERARAKAEAARQAARAEAAAKSDYLATVSQEVRTPLTGVIGMAELLTETDLNDEQTALVDTVRQSAEALQAVLADVMDFSTLEAGETELEDAPFDMREVAARSIEAHLAEARKKGLELVFDVPPELMTQCRGDGARVGRMVSVLVGNAVKFTERGEIVVRLRSRDRGGSAEMSLEVSDTGIGIAPEDRDRIFDPFVRGDAQASERYGGTGLGLAIAVRLARLMSGRIDLSSEPGQGSVFTLRFVHRMRQTARGAAHGPDLAGRRYLVIEDSAAARRVLERQLTHWGAEVVAVAGVEEGEDALWSDMGEPLSFDALLIDATLPGGDGPALAAKFGDRAASVPIVLLTPGDPKAAAAAVSDGLAVGFVQKPFATEELEAALAAAGQSAAAAARAGGGAVAPVAPAAEAALAPACIVVVDDNAANRILIEKFLANEPMTLIHAPDGVGAVEAWADWAPDLILMDVSMPRMDGLEATRRIRASERAEGLARVPIIALTAKAMSDDREKCLEAGMDDYVAKPIRKAELKSKITEWTRSRRMIA